MSSDEDYMSDALLQKCGDTKPGLAPKRAQKQYEKEKRQNQARKKNTTIPKHKLEATLREAGLKKTISSDSKGFALLQKMGYKEGMGIGKQGSGRVEPVPIEIRSGRAGLGQDTEMKRKAMEINSMRAAMAAKRLKGEEKLKESFQDRMRDRFSEKNTERDLRIAQKACLQLDQQQGITDPGEPFFWPDYILPIQEEDKEDASSDVCQDRDSDNENIVETPAYLEFSDFERLDILTRYLRNTYFYCIWCGTRYEDKNDLERNCPGNSADEHD